MNFHGNFLFDVIPFVFGIIGLIFYLGLFALIVLGIVFLYKKIQNESKIDRIEKELQSVKLILENMNKDSKGDLDEK
jgi:hypothetical protein